MGLIGKEAEISDGTLLCPKCGENYLHHGPVHVFERQHGEDSDGWCVSVGDKCAVQVTAVADKDMAGRRNSLGIKMECEHCGPVGQLLIIQHKGLTLTEWA